VSLWFPADAPGLKAVNGFRQPAVGRAPTGTDCFSCKSLFLPRGASDGWNGNPGLDVRVYLILFPANVDKAHAVSPVTTATFSTRTPNARAAVICRPHVAFA
jgi:hypothetical protein